MRDVLTILLMISCLLLGYSAYDLSDQLSQALVENSRLTDSILKLQRRSAAQANQLAKRPVIHRVEIVYRDLP